MSTQEIINLKQYADAFRSTGYKNIESAASEIIDNSLEAEATNIFLIAKNTLNEETGRKNVTEIAYLDNGFGMDKNLVQSCLRIGYGTRVERRGMGRFGVGLPQSSMYACPIVEVYSWIKGKDKCYKSFLDINKIKNGEQTGFDEPEECEIPKEYQNFLNCRMFDTEFDFSESGTLVIWKECDNISPKTVNPLFERLQFAFGQKFRYWIHNKSKNIFLIDYENIANSRKVLPNDPLLLMQDNYILGNPDKPGDINPGDPLFHDPIFEPFTNEINKTGIVEKKIKYYNNGEIKESNVILKFSVVKERYYDKTAFTTHKDPGNSGIGKYVKKLEGISIVRAGREIDFGKFDFYDNVNEPTHRWWGCEIYFEPELDEAFGVANNKQHVELISLPPEDYEEEEVKPIWFQLNATIKETINAMYKRNKAVRENTRSKPEVIYKPSEDIINRVEMDNPAKTETQEVREREPEKVHEVVKEILIEQGINEPTEEDIDKLLLNKVNIIYKSNNRAPFFDYETSMGICKCLINTDHPFYKEFLLGIENNQRAQVAFELFIASLIRARDEIIDSEKKAMYDDVIDDWNAKLTKYIKSLLNE